MIQLTRLNNHPLVVNSDLIKFVEQAPDTVITLVNGDKIVVRESAQDVPRTRGAVPPLGAAGDHALLRQQWFRSSARSSARHSWK